MVVHVAVAYWRDDGIYPRSGDAARRNEVYLRNIATMAATWRRVVDFETTLVMCTNVQPEGHLHETLDGVGVERRFVPFDHAPPPDFYERFTASMYTVDVLAAADREGWLADDDLLVVIDPDVVWVNDPYPLLQRTRELGCLVHTIPNPPEHEDLGVTRYDLGSLISEISGQPGPEAPPYVGGELVACTEQYLPRVVELADEAWEGSLALWRAGRRPVLHTEEHVLTYVASMLELGDSPAEGLIRRLWTRGGAARNVGPTDMKLVAWHLLQEKPKGLWDLYDDLVSARGPFADVDDETYRHRLARRVAVRPGLGLAVAVGASRLARRLLGRGHREVPG